MRDRFALGLCASSCEFFISKCIITQNGGFSFGGHAKLGTFLILSVMNKQIDQQNSHNNSDNHTNDNQHRLEREMSSMGAIHICGCVMRR